MRCHCHEYHFTFVSDNVMLTPATEAVLEEVRKFFGGHVWHMAVWVWKMTKGSVAYLWDYP